MVIALVSTAVALGGAERYMFELARWLVQRDERVLIVVADEIARATRSEMTGTAVPIHNAAIGWAYGPEDNAGSDAYLTKLKRQQSGMTKLLKELTETPDLLLFNANWPTHYAGTMMAARHAGVDFAVHFHLCPHRIYLSPAAVTAHADVLPAARFLSCVSENNRFFLRRSFGEDTEFRVILNGSRFEISNASQRELLQKERENTFLIVGRLEHQKGLIDIIPALVRLHTRTGFSIDVLGDGPLRPLLERSLPSEGGAVRVMGDVSDIQARMSRATAMLLPSHFEGLSLSILEALSVGCIPIVSRASSASEVIEDGRNGFLFDVADWRSMLCAMDRFVACNQTTMRRQSMETGRRFSRRAMFESMAQAIGG